ncbi:MAG: methionine--tRNA ligase [Firmicutes bacterium HGW-Firmicutes-1]|jgi:methionyl-tRNA synthetase|nr:MAG: methionine--tRNA ligase [Firmicutes bacterium HGW-Firmicutes-1]
MNSIYITTPIYYASGSPHLGHAYTTILVDSFIKYYKMLGYDTKFTTGTDEHGLKIERISEKNNKKPEELVNELAKKFQNAWGKLEIEYDDFIRTTEDRHKTVVMDMWNRMEKNGDIYLGKYEGLYCVDCEQYYAEGELLEDNVCPIHNKNVEVMSEDTYFFKLSKYHDTLTKYIEDNPDFIQPITRKNEVLGFLRCNTLQDLSISRTSFKWGIPVPNDDKHIMYVWIDALTNYISSLGGIDSEDFIQYWSNTIHFIGKDILRFHAIYWPCMLLSVGIPLPKAIIVHGWWTISNKKISKSDPATKIDPTALAEDITLDGLRYFLLKELTLGKDGNIDWNHLIASLNSGLANNIGNLVNRTVNMINKYLGGETPIVLMDTINEFDLEVKNGAFVMVEKAMSYMDEFNPAGAVNSIIEYGNILNGYLDKTLPWQLVKYPEQKDRLGEIFAYLIEGIRWISNLIYPFTPKIATVIKEQVDFEKEFKWVLEFELNKKVILNDGIIVFKRISKDEEKELLEKWEK